MDSQSRSTRKLRELLEIEQQAQERWDEERIFELDAPAAYDADAAAQGKFLTTFPYPYMNGQMHLGHVFSLSKNEFSMGFERLNGKRTLWPFGLHCTGMPIKASADKLVREMELFGFPPQFPQSDDKEDEEVQAEEEVVGDGVKNKAKGKKSKVAAKTGNAKYQWEIMRDMGIDDDQIRLFTNPQHWLRYFPLLCVRDLKKMGVKVDWRRSFITTDANPYYDSFVRWQFFRLRDGGRVKFGKRYTIFSPQDQQPCMDHDRSSGEGVAPQEYTLVKIQVANPPAKLLAKISQPALAKVFLVAATLRPETMFGQTNCWLHPDIFYIMVPASSNSSSSEQYYICSERSARNMLYQGLVSAIEGPGVVSITGAELMGSALHAPLTPHSTVYVLPMLTVKATKGTGVVTSVPSDAPDDFAALRDLRQKPALREKYGIEEFMLLEPVPIIDTPGLGNLPAVTVCEEMKITSQNDAEKLKLAKEKVYKLGFYDGVLSVGPFAGSKVQDVKKKMQQVMIDDGQAMVYMEPEKEVKSRSGDECVVALCDQWYLDYGDAEWKALAKKALDQLNTFGDEVRNNFEATLDWLMEHACSRSFGLGTKLPWDPQYLIESLSDSTIYMAYYTVAHLLQSDLYGLHPGKLGITPDQLTPEVWDFIFCLSDQLPVSEREPKPPAESALRQLRREFEFWYPVDLRSSGKDLIPNHLTYFLFNHTAIWPERQELWPQSVRANGHLLLNSEKMAKSTGNYLTLHDAVLKYSADGMRLALADAGDGIEDANFEEKLADASLLRLYTLLEWVKDIVRMANDGELRVGDAGSGTLKFCDAAFSAEIDKYIGIARDFYQQMLYKKVVNSIYELMAGKDRYIQLCMEQGPERDLITRYIEVQLLLLSPFCPHLCDHLWRCVLNKGSSVLHARWPSVLNSDAAQSEIVLDELQYLSNTVHDFRLRLDKYLSRLAKQQQQQQHQEQQLQPSHAEIVIAKSFPSWQQSVLDILLQLMQESSDKRSLPDNKIIAQRLAKAQVLQGKAKKEAMPFVAMVKQNLDKFLLAKSSVIDEQTVLQNNAEYIRRQLRVEAISISLAEAGSADAELCRPGEPLIRFERRPSRQLKLRCAQPGSGLFAFSVDAFNGECVSELRDRAARVGRGLSAGRGDSDRLRLWRYANGIVDARRIPLPLSEALQQQQLLELPLEARIEFGDDLLKDSSGNAAAAAADVEVVELKQEGRRFWANELVFGLVA